MSKQFTGIITAFLIIMSLGFDSYSNTWHKTYSFNLNHVYQMIQDPQHSNRFLVNTDEGLYAITPSTHHQSPQHLLKEPAFSVLATSFGYFVATTKGLWHAKDLNSEWNIDFHRDNHLVFDVTLLKGKMYIATKFGVFVRDVNSKNWTKILNEESFKVRGHKNYLYIATHNDVYQLDVLTGFKKRIFSSVSKVLGEEDEYIGNILFMFIADDERIVISTRQKLLVSHDQGNHWFEIPSYGLPLDKVQSIKEVFFKGERRLIIATMRGVFVQEEDIWNEIYQGLDSLEAYDLFVLNNQTWLATNKGIYRLSKKKLRSSQKFSSTSEDLNDIIDDEPTVTQVQHRAEQYAEVSPYKIKQWRKRARMKAFLPSLSVSVDRNSNYAYRWDSGQNPDALLKGVSFEDWEISAEWELGDLIWNNEQTSIDVRSKLMVELREDILDQVTRLYFERRRLQAEMYLVSHLAPLEKVQKNIRIQELTGFLDAYTGGWFSRKLQR